MRENRRTHKQKSNMPFTLSHPVVAIPLKKYLGDFGGLSALFIGAMIPDFVYMLPPEFVYYYRLESHSFMGLFKVCLPMGIGFFYLYHLLMAPVLVSLFPAPLRHKLPPHLSLGLCPPINNAHAVIMSILIGAATHIIWDWLTHEGGIPQYITLLQQPVAVVDGYPIMSYRIFQHLSTVLGLMLLMWWIWRWYRETTKAHQVAWQPGPTLRYAALFLLVLVPGLVWLIVIYYSMPESDVLFGLHSLQLGFKQGLVAAAATLIVTTSVLGLVYQWLLYRSQVRRIPAFDATQTN